MLYKTPEPHRLSALDSQTGAAMIKTIRYRKSCLTQVHLEHSLKIHRESLAPLDSTGWLSEQSEELQDWFVANGKWRNYSAGDSLYRTGDSSDGLYGLGSGAMDVEFAPRDVESFVLIRVHPGGWSGQGALIPGKERPVNLTTPIDSRVFFVSQGALLKLLSDRPDFWPAFFSLTVLHIMHLTEFLCEALTLTPSMRLARLLLRLSNKSEDIVISQQDIGIMLGVPRSSLRRAIKTLTRVGAISTGYGRITVTDHSKLESLGHTFPE